MKFSSTDTNSHPRKQQTTISSTVVRCICVTASCIVTACGLLGLGVTCFVIELVEPSAAPCPFLLTVIVFAVAGLLFFLSFITLLVICRRRNRLRRKAMLEDLPVACVDEEFKSTDEECKIDEEKEKCNSSSPEGPHQSEDNFDMSQKSVDVSLWIEQQKPSESAVDCFPLENRDGATSKDLDEESSDGEVTPL